LAGPITRKWFRRLVHFFFYKGLSSLHAILDGHCLGSFRRKFDVEAHGSSLEIALIQLADDRLGFRRICHFDQGITFLSTQFDTSYRAMFREQVFQIAFCGVKNQIADKYRCAFHGLPRCYVVSGPLSSDEERLNLHVFGKMC